MRNGTLLMCVFCLIALCFGCESSKKSSPDTKKESPAKSQNKQGNFVGGKTDSNKSNGGKEPSKSNGDKANVGSGNQLPDVAPTSTSEPIESLDVAGLINCLGDADSSKRLQAAQRLVTLGEPSIAELQEGLQAENYHVRAGAAFALGLFGSQAQEAAADLQEVSQNDEREAVRSAAAFALDSIQNENKKAD